MSFLIYFSTFIHHFFYVFVHRFFLEEKGELKTIITIYFFYFFQALKLTLWESLQTFIYHEMSNIKLCINKVKNV